jgi:hypothetical protein
VVSSTAVAPALYQINRSTGIATFVGATDLGIGGVAGVNGAYYAFDDLTNHVESLDLANGHTSFVSNFDPAAGVIQGAASIPEPASLVPTGIGMAVLVVCRRRRRRP